MQLLFEISPKLLLLLLRESCFWCHFKVTTTVSFFTVRALVEARQEIVHQSHMTHMWRCAVTWCKYFKWQKKAGGEKLGLVPPNFLNPEDEIIEICGCGREMYWRLTVNRFCPPRVCFHYGNICIMRFFKLTRCWLVLKRHQCQHVFVCHNGHSIR